MNLLKIIKSLNIQCNLSTNEKVTMLLSELYLFLRFASVNHIAQEWQNELLLFLKDYDEKEYKNSKWLVVANKRFTTSEFLKDSLLSIYPKFGTIKGKLYPLITGDLDKLFEDYAKKIGYSIDTHKEVLDIVQWAKDKELLNIGIEKFILSYYWESLKELRGKDNVTSNIIADDF